MTEKLPLRSATPDAWAASALSDPIALLSDHAYLERKAASNALELLNRWPEPERPAAWTSALSSVARDEAMHLNQVIQILQKRGGHLERLHRSAYAADLRALVRRGQAKDELVDRLLVSAL
ncbi:MAG: tRNA-(ms[2]io[6]A)-hydroxylase, partial [Elusimicrobia bacterium]|nr:tRNA-(ms[2]io[6]A)-hydroxylase [Elusimicrobiota bacterium]